MATIEVRLLQDINSRGQIDDSGAYAAEIGIDHNALVGVIKSLVADELISEQV